MDTGLYWTFNLLFITLNILALTNDISFIIISCNGSYQHDNIFNESNGKFDKLNNNCCTSMFNNEYIITTLILNITLLFDAMNNALVFLKSKRYFSIV